jgi:hypothetical protein
MAPNFIGFPLPGKCKASTVAPRIDTSACLALIRSEADDGDETVSP